MENREFYKKQKELLEQARLLVGTTLSKEEKERIENMSIEESLVEIDKNRVVVKQIIDKWKQEGWVYG